MRLLPVRLSVRRAMIALAVVVIAGGLYHQWSQPGAREVERKRQLGMAKLLMLRDESMREFLGERGIDIVRNATSAEGLRVTGRYQQEGYPVAASGEVLDETFTRRLRKELLDPWTYNYLNADDLPDPEVGVRLWRGKESLDVLFKLSDWGHLDVWAFVRDERGRIVHGDQGWLCFHDPGFAEAAREAFQR